ncbi:MAG: sulfotransferase domain-containing protein [Gammaproteobacteria bacterium]|nr:sulfotransferase domain-containing protein [Gammaproteobacteria bacterium]NNL52049.1 hypothetical protein [Woeseiaceae bacterium]
MADVQSGLFSRYRRYVKKKILVSAGGLRPSALLGRYNGAKVLINSIPKAGTHLVEAILDLAPRLRNGGARTLSCWDTLDKACERGIRQIRHGQFKTGHLPGIEPVVNAVMEESLSVIFVIRDPRDIVVSRYHYIRDIDHTHAANSLFSGLSNADALRLSIIGRKPDFASIGELLKAFEPWLDFPGLQVRFEDVSPRNVDRASLEQQIGRICRFLKISDARRGDMATRLLTKTTSTLRKGQARQWTKEFTDEHLDLFHSEVPESLLKKYGYN